MFAKLYCLFLIFLVAHKAQSVLVRVEDSNIRLVPLGTNKYIIRIPHADGSTLEETVIKNAPGEFQLTGKISQPTFNPAGSVVLSYPPKTLGQIKTTYQVSGPQRMESYALPISSRIQYLQPQIPQLLLNSEVLADPRPPVDPPPFYPPRFAPTFNDIPSNPILFADAPDAPNAPIAPSAPYADAPSDLGYVPYADAPSAYNDDPNPQSPAYYNSNANDAEVPDLTQNDADKADYLQ